MSGRGGWTRFKSPGRPPKAVEIPRCPEGSWWMDERYREWESFAAKAQEEQERMQRRGISPDPLVWVK